MTPTLLRGAFSPFGNIIDLSMDPPRNCAFVTYEKMESADQAVAELNGTQVESVQLKVNIARKQPMLDAATGKSVWGSLGKDEALPPRPAAQLFLFPLQF